MEEANTETITTLLSRQVHEENMDSTEKLGKSGKKGYVSVADMRTLSVSLLFAAIALAAVFSSNFATTLGQTNQLIVVGFCLTIMGFNTQRQLNFLVLSVEVLRAGPTLQNIDSLLRQDIFAWGATRGMRAYLAASFSLPLLLSVSYKNFVGGETNIAVSSIGGFYGLCGPPGMQTIGAGLSLLVNAALPFFIDPGYPKSYGFNTFVASNTTTVMLDAPYISNFAIRTSIWRILSINGNC